MAEYSRFASGSYFQTATGASQVINLPFQPTNVRLTNFTASGAFALHGIPSAAWDVSVGQGTASVQVVTTGPVLRTSNVLVNGISTFAAGTALSFGPAISIVSFDKATGIVTTSVPHGLSVNNVIFFQGLYQTSTTGLPQMAGIPIGVVAVLSPTTFRTNWQTNESNYTSLTGSPAGAQLKQLFYPDLYLPGFNIISGMSFASFTSVQCATPHNYVVGQQVAFRIPPGWLNGAIDPTLNATAPSSEVYAYVTALNDDFKFTCSLNTSNITTFNPNQLVSSVPGLNYPQVVAVGDVNSGGTPFNGGNLYPSPVFPTFSLTSPTINGPAIFGAFVNNTRQGFIIGGGAAAADALSTLSGALNDQVFWEAYIPDIRIL
jgi:hypothetical protein